MEVSELDLAISELETRLERLRSLYEQYFLGIEKTPPHVARKDVDRRIWELRRVKIRNTAKRFKLQTIIQRYNTFQQYWQRILREIENGTYRRHVLRAERSTLQTADSKGTEPPVQQPRTPPDPHASEELGQLLDSGADLDRELERAFAEAATKRVAPKPGPERQGDAERRKVETLNLDMEGFDLEPATTTGRAATGASRVRRPAAPVGTGDSPVARLGKQPSVPRPRPPVAAWRGEPQAEQRIKPAAPPARKPPAGRPQAGASPELSDQRIAELHTRLLEAKRKTREGGQVSVKGLAKSLRAAETKLRQQHKNRRIDFDIVIKNGRAVVKPVVR